MGNLQNGLHVNTDETTNDTSIDFKVYNVDAKLLKHSKGIIRILANDMVLNQENRQPILWPLSGIRRYGCYKNIFLFECGRRCPTGEGLFAFKCSKAQQLHDTLHVSLLSKNAPSCGSSSNNNLVRLSATSPQVSTQPMASLTSTLVSSTTSQVPSTLNNVDYVNNFNIIRLSSMDDPDLARLRDICFNGEQTNEQEQVESSNAQLNYVVPQLHSNDAPSPSQMHTPKMHTQIEYTFINDDKTRAIKQSHEENELKRCEYMTLTTTASVSTNRH